MPHLKGREKALALRPDRTPGAPRESSLPISMRHPLPLELLKGAEVENDGRKEKDDDWRRYGCSSPAGLRSPSDLRAPDPEVVAKLMRRTFTAGLQAEDPGGNGPVHGARRGRADPASRRPAGDSVLIERLGYCVAFVCPGNPGRYQTYLLIDHERILEYRARCRGVR